MRDPLDLLRAVLRGEASAWPGGSTADENAFAGVCVQYAVAGLVERRLRESDEWSQWPAGVTAPIRHAVLDGVAASSARRVRLREILDALAAAHVSAVLIKGAAIAETHYPDAWLRPSGDADLLVAPAAVKACHDVLGRLGYAALNETAGRFVTYQHHFVRGGDRAGLIIDLHWKLNNPQLFADALTFEEIARDAMALPALGAAARAPSPVHSLFHAVVHRVAHADGAVNLLTLSDIHQIVTSLTDDDLRTFAELAASRRMARVASSGLEAAGEWFATEIPASTRDALARAAARRERSADYLRAMRPIDVFVSDLAALSSWRDRTRLMREHLLPPAEYMLRAYGVSSRRLLPALYAHRFVTGARRWFGRP